MVDRTKVVAAMELAEASPEAQPGLAYQIIVAHIRVPVRAESRPRTEQLRVIPVSIKGIVTNLTINQPTNIQVSRQNLIIISGIQLFQ